MVHRMLDYKAMLFRKYLIPFRQYVIYLGKEKLTMESSLQTLDLTFKYNLLALNTIDYKIFLNSNQPEEVILSVLANFNKETPENALKYIISRLESDRRSGNYRRRFGVKKILQTVAYISTVA
jgi:hypothetical protein